MSRVARKIKDNRLLKLIRGYLSAGIMSGGLVGARQTGTPQGSPLSPLLSNVLLDDVDQELERRGHRFCRYADDATIYVKSRRAGERVMASLTHFLEGRLRLKVNRAKSAVDRPWNRTFLGYTVTRHRQPRLKPAPTSVKRAKDRIRQITHQGRGRNIRQVIKEINAFTRGWVSYFRLTSVKAAFEQLDQWLRRRLRKILWEQWRQPETRRRQLMALGVDATRARKAAATGLGAWWNAGASHLHAAVTLRLLTQWGLCGLLDQLRGWQRSI
jgi:RNA-directed DNA polymerase